MERGGAGKKASTRRVVLASCRGWGFAPCEPVGGGYGDLGASPTRGLMWKFWQSGRGGDGGISPRPDRRSASERTAVLRRVTAEAAPPSSAGGVFLLVWMSGAEGGVPAPPILPS